MTPNTLFEKPEYELIPDEAGPRFYANVDNRIHRQYGSGAVKERPVVVPTALFTLMRETLKIAPEDEVTLYLVPDEDYYVFGMAWGDNDNNVADLWFYTGKTLPPFLK